MSSWGRYIFSVSAALWRLRQLLVLRQSHIPGLFSFSFLDWFNLVLPPKLDQDRLHGEVPFPLRQTRHLCWINLHTCQPEHSHKITECIPFRFAGPRMVDLLWR